MAGIALPPVIGELKVKASEAKAKIGEVIKESDELARKTAGNSEATGSAWNKVGKSTLVAATAVAGGAALIGHKVVEMGADFQENMTLLVTGAQVPKDQIGAISDGILRMAPAVGQSTQQLSDGMYMIASAGYKGAEGLNVLQASAEGAKVGNADLGTTADAVTTALTDYHLKAGDAADVMSKLVATVGNGKTHMQDLAGSMSQFMPIASQLGVSMDDALGAMATMTGQGIDANRSATSLRFGMMALANETSKGAAALQFVGLSSKQVAGDLRTKGLKGTLDEITEAIGKKFPKGSAEYTQAIADIVGGTRGMSMALALTGDNAATYTQNIKAVGEAHKDAAGHVEGFAETQEDFNFKLAQAKEVIETAGVKLGTVLLPYVTKGVEWFTQFTSELVKNQNALKVLGGIVVAAMGILAVGAFVKLGGAVVSAGKDVIAFGRRMADLATSARIAGMYAVDGLKKMGPAIQSGLGAIDSAGNKIVSLGGKFIEGGKAAVEWGASVTKSAAQAVAAGARAAAMWTIQTARTIAAKTAQLAAAAATKIVAAAQWLLNAAMAANPIGLIIAAIVLLVGGLILAYNKVGWFKDFVNAAFKLVQTAIAAVVDWVTGTAVPFFVNAWNAIGQAAAWLYNNIIAPYFQMTQAIISGVVDFIMGTVVPGFESGFEMVGNAVQNVIGFFVSFGQNVANVVGNVIGFISGLQSQILGVFAGAGSWLINIGSQIIQGLISGIEGAVGGAIQAVVNVGSSILDGIKGALGIHSPSTVFEVQVGDPIAKGTILGVTKNRGAFIGALRSFTTPTGAAMSPQLAGVGLGQAMAGNGASQAQGQMQAGRAPIYITVNVQSNADPHEIAREMAFALMLQG